MKTSFRNAKPAGIAARRHTNRRFLSARPGVRPLTLSLLGLFLLTAGMARPAQADSVFINADSGPAVVDWPGNHFLMVNIVNSKIGTFNSQTTGGLHFYTGTKRGVNDGSAADADWQDGIFIDMGFRLKDRPQVVVQPNNKTLVFVNDNNQKIWCHTMKCGGTTNPDGSFTADGSKVVNQGDQVLPITIDGGFKSYCIIPTPIKAANGFNAMLLMYLDNSNNIKCEKIEFAWQNNANNTGGAWRLNRIQYDAGHLCSANKYEQKLSACLVPSRDSSTAASFPYTLIVTSLYAPPGRNGNILTRQARLDSNGLRDSTQSVDTYMIQDPNNRMVRPTEDLIAYVGAEGRPAVNCLDANMHPIHYVCDLSQSVNQQWQWDTSYGPDWDNAAFRWTPTTHSYVSWNDSDETKNTVNVATSNGKTAYTQHGTEHVRPLIRYALGEKANSNWMSGNLEHLFNAHLRPINFIGGDQKDANGNSRLKSLLVGVIEGPPPVPWQNFDANDFYHNTVCGSTVLTLSATNSATIESETSTGVVATTSGAVGIAWDITAESAFNAFASQSVQKTATTTFNSDFKLVQKDSNSPVTIPGDIANMGTAFVLQQDCQVYEYTTTWDVNDKQGHYWPVSGSVRFQQVALQNQHLAAIPYYMSRKYGIVDNQALYPGRLSTYYRNGLGQIDNYPHYMLHDNSDPVSKDDADDTTFDTLHSSYAASGGVNTGMSVSLNSTTGNGTSFDLQALVGVGSSDLSLLAGFHASGSWKWSSAKDKTCSISTSVLPTPAMTPNPHFFMSYAYKTYWLAENPAFTASFRNVLLEPVPPSPLRQTGLLTDQQRSWNSFVNSMIADGSAPWVVTYALDGTGAWATGVWADLPTMQQDDKN